MIEPVNRPLKAGRWVAFTHSVYVEGLDLTDATFAMQVRDSWNGGQIRADLSTVTTAAAEGVRFVGLDTVNGLPVSEIGIRINETTMEAMSAEAAGIDPDADLSLVYDLHITRAGLAEVFMRGAFIVQAGSTE
ncbi:hypothetical protein [Aurantiacibacter luteus]|uniref:Uncharacterized protein n=1 Tax=Aurantiacibacter luteus TaxID=1581420 RepID=A0A0G9MP16_9SPHN|nr:hypothetical protein [Aurantiacibacter luteus]KLE32462.1 hypothetical protein AAW00_13645 [Aurantiacibacter luteus]